MKKINVWIPKKMLARALKLKKDTGISRSELIRRGMELFMDRYEAKQRRR